MHKAAVAIGFAVVAAGVPLAAMATVRVAVDLTHQRMKVTSSQGTYNWPISSARAGYVTPTGNYSAAHLEKMHYSRKYDNSPMPHSIFFSGGYAIHGSYATGSLGRPASHGCIRLAPGNAATLYSLVKAEGAQISISGAPPITTYVARAKNASKRYAARSTRVRSYADVPYGTRAAYRAYYPTPNYGYPPPYGAGYGAAPATLFGTPNDFGF